jgi:hypothetical protein
MGNAILRGPTAAFALSVAAAFMGSCQTERVIVEPPLWVCTGTVADALTGRRLVGAQFWVDGYQDGISDSAGVYRAIVGYSPSEVDTLRFSLKDYRDAIALLDTARVTADHTLAMNIRMLSLKEDH